jgi:tRNA-2-methylthio-N6-dimethylallyladenosine synthase
MNEKKKLFIYTMGCQMNVYDAGQMQSILASVGYEKTATWESADLVIANTCAIREKAEQKAVSFLGRLARIKQQNPALIVAIGGCMAQQEGEKILQRLPHIDLVFGTDAIFRLPGLIRQVEAGGRRVVDIEINEPSDGDRMEAKPVSIQEGVSRFVTIMRGCNNFCAYCVVPFVRGRERSRSPEEVVREVEALAGSGAREVTLLGQNVNSYGQKEGFCTFARLIEKVGAVEQLKRIRFTTSHPKDLSVDLMEAFKTNEKLCNHIHLPVQSGSDAVLKRMNRKYARSQYLAGIERLRRIRPDIAISSDIIVGFPGETDRDFSDTLDLIRTVAYDSLFVFQYSDRPQAPAAAFPEKAPEAEKNKRLQIVLDLQKAITLQKNTALVGSTVEILVEGMSRKHPLGNRDDRETQWSGRTTTNKIVNFTCGDAPAPGYGDLCGKLVKVSIGKALAHSLKGKLVKAEPEPLRLKGEEHYAA